MAKKKVAKKSAKGEKATKKAKKRR